MDTKNAYKPTSSSRSSTDNSQRQSSEADVTSQEGAKEQPIFYLEPDDSPSRDDAAETTNLSSSGNNNNITEGSRNQGKRTIDRTAATHSSVHHGARGEDRIVGAPTSCSDDVFSYRHSQTLRDDGIKNAAQNPQEESVFSGAQTPQDSCRSPPKSIPPIHRANSSPLTTVCRGSDSHMVVRCQLTFHDLSDLPDVPYLPSSCPAAFSPVWTKLVTPAPRKTDSRSSERKRRHTVGPTTHAQQIRHLQGHHLRLQGSGGGGGGGGRSPSSPPAVFRGPGVGGRSVSDPELHHLLVKEVGQRLRKMSDEFNFSRTGERLTTVKERTVSEDSSDDEM